MKNNRKIKRKYIYLILLIFFVIWNYLVFTNYVFIKKLPKFIVDTNVKIIPYVTSMIYCKLYKPEPLEPSDDLFDANPLDYFIAESGGLLCRKTMSDTERSGNNEAQSYYQDIFIDINPSKTAIVLIDIYDDTFLDDLVKHKIVPLLKLAREKNITIVHALPGSIPFVHRSLLPFLQPGDIVSSGEGNVDKELMSHGIDTILYAGYDTFQCLLDKPNGIFHANLRGRNFRNIVIRDCVISLTEEMRIVAIDMIESVFGCSTTLKDLYDFFETTPPKEICYEVSPIETYPEPQFNPSETALVVVGAFCDHSNTVWRDKIKINIQEKLVPLIELARANNITIIHVPNKNGIAEDCKPNPGEPVIYSEKQFRQIIKEKNIKKLLYGGYALNQEIFFGPAGIARLLIQARYKKNKIAEYYIVSDCTLAKGIPGILSEEIMKNTVLRDWRKLNYVTSEHLPRMIHRGEK